MFYYCLKKNEKQKNLWLETVAKKSYQVFPNWAMGNIGNISTKWSLWFYKHPWYNTIFLYNITNISMQNK